MHKMHPLSLCLAATFILVQTSFADVYESSGKWSSSKTFACASALVTAKHHADGACESEVNYAGCEDGKYSNCRSSTLTGCACYRLVSFRDGDWLCGVRWSCHHDAPEQQAEPPVQQAEPWAQAAPPAQTATPSLTVGSSFRDTLRSGVEGPEMVVIPAGRFHMGCILGSECNGIGIPAHEVVITRSFAISKYEVTFEDYDRYSNPFKVDDEGWGRGPASGYQHCLGQSGGVCSVVVGADGGEIPLADGGGMGVCSTGR